MRNPLLLLTLALTLATTAAARPFTARDLHSLQRVSETQGSPNGDRIAFVVRTTDFEANRGRTDIWTVGVDGRNAAPLTTDPASESNPRWAPDGKSLYFLSTRSGSN